MDIQSGHVAVITGAGGGLGSALAQGLAGKRLRPRPRRYLKRSARKNSRESLLQGRQDHSAYRRCH